MVSGGETVPHQFKVVDTNAWCQIDKLVTFLVRAATGIMNDFKVPRSSSCWQRMPRADFGIGWRWSIIQGMKLP